MSIPQSTRRQFLRTGALAAAAASAGCLGGSGTSDDSARRSLRLSLSHRDGTLRDRHVVALDEMRPEGATEAFRTTLDGSTYTSQYRRPFSSPPEDPTFTRHEGTYYRLGSVVVDERTETHPVLRLRDPESSDGESAPDAVVADRLPESDQRAVHVAHMAARARGNEGGVPWGLVQRGGYVYRSAEAVETSRLLTDSGPDHVVYHDRTYAVEIARERFHEPVYRATVDAVATSPARMEAILRVSLVDARISRSDLQPAARDVLRAARGDGHDEAHPYSAGYRAVLKALHERAYLDGDVERDAHADERGRGTLLYGGDYYDYRLRFRSATEP